MKSIMEEASSIFKAIENGWIKAGKPNEFSIKIFEEPKKNFLGLTIRSAKIGIFFGETKAEALPKQKREVRPIQQKPAREQIKREHPKTRQLETSQERQIAPEEQATAIWTDIMMEDIQSWLKRSLELGGIKVPEYTVENHMFHLKINFNSPLLEDHLKEKYLFSSISLLMLQMLKHKHKRPLKGYKIILSS